MGFSGMLRERIGRMIAIIDYGVGNLHSVSKAFGYLQIDSEVTDDETKIAQASHIVLPGVGAFYDAKKKLEQSGMQQQVSRAIEQGKPVLGICLGMQLLCRRSQEGKSIEGMGIFDVVVEPLKVPYKVPHMGWNSLEIRQKECALFQGIEEGANVYFVHSYYVPQRGEEYEAAVTDYGVGICAAMHRDNVYATQFHPEKSGKIGLRMLKNFAQI